MVLPWESLSDYTYSESMGLLMNIIPAVIFAVSALLVILKPLASALSRFGTNYIFLLLCLLNAIVLYFECNTILIPTLLGIYYSPPPFRFYVRDNL